MKYFITYHAIERLQERFPLFYNKHPQLKSWSKSDSPSKLKSLFDKWILSSEENKSHLNNSVYMIKLYEKYGYDTEYKFMEYIEENIVFVLAKNRSDNYFKLVTLMPTEFRPSVKNTKYSDKQKKEDKHSKFIMDWYNNISVSNKSEIIPKGIEIIESSVDCSTELEKILCNCVQNNQTNILDKLSNTKTLHQYVMDNMMYDFIYIKRKGGGKAIEFQKVSDISLDCHQDFVKSPIQKVLNKESTKSVVTKKLKC